MLAATSNQSTDTALIFEEFTWLSSAALHPQGYGWELQGREKAILSFQNSWQSLYKILDWVKLFLYS